MNCTNKDNKNKSVDKEKLWGEQANCHHQQGVLKHYCLAQQKVWQVNATSHYSKPKQALALPLHIFNHCTKTKDK